MDGILLTGLVISRARSEKQKRIARFADGTESTTSIGVTGLRNTVNSIQALNLHKIDLHKTIYFQIEAHD